MVGLLKDFFALFFPGICHACGGLLVNGEHCICSYCSVHLPKTGFHRQKDNAFTKIFQGRLSLETGTALYYYLKGGLVQSMIHGLKYRGIHEIGLFAGRQLGRVLCQSPFYHSVDCIVPVPLHPGRLRQRGYNQSEVFGQGLAEAMEIPLRSDLLKRAAATSTQTRKRRFSRWENVAEAFIVPEPALAAHRKILLVDDVLTTGSTLEACASRLLEVENTRLWMATMAITL
jgi:ComF family protein